MNESFNFLNVKLIVDSYAIVENFTLYARRNQWSFMHRNFFKTLNNIIKSNG